jgi:hypothetical protein
MAAMPRQRIADGTRARSNEQQRNSEPGERAAHHAVSLQPPELVML